MSTASRGPYWARMADSYGTLFRKNSVLREKLVVVLALSECAPPAFEDLDRVPGGGLAGTALRMAAGGMSYGLALLIGAHLFSPVRLWMAVREALMDPAIVVIGFRTERGPLRADGPAQRPTGHHAGCREYRGRKRCAPMTR